MADAVSRADPNPAGCLAVFYVVGMVVILAGELLDWPGWLTALMVGHP